MLDNLNNQNFCSINAPIFHHHHNNNTAVAVVRVGHPFPVSIVRYSVLRNSEPNTSMQRLFCVVTNSFPAAAAACFRDVLQVKWDTLYNYNFAISTTRTLYQITIMDILYTFTRYISEEMSAKKVSLVACRP